MRMNRARNKGVTLIELLAAIGVISILVGLTLPAVARAREAARRLVCQSNLRQIGVAVHAYHDLNNCYPISATTVVRSSPRGGRSFYLGSFSPHVRLLPWIEQRVLFDAINFDVGASPLATIGYPEATEEEIHSAEVNATVLLSRLSVYLCPSDMGLQSPGAVNYRGNTGVGGYPSRSYLHPDSGNGFFMPLYLVKAADVTDGLSNTVSFSERVRGTGEGDPRPNRDYWLIRSGAYGTADDGLAACMIAARSSQNRDAFRFGGDYWMWEGLDRTSYVHAQEPNGKIPDCLQGALKTPPGISTARSAHDGGVNVLMGDGSARFAADSIARDVWRAIGTRNGLESLSSEW